MNFGQAIEALKQGKKVARKGWNGKGMFIFIADEIGFCTKVDMKAYEESGVDVHDSICMLTADGEIVVEKRHAGSDTEIRLAWRLFGV